MAGNLPVGNDYQSFYGNIENSVLNRQFANEDQQMAMGRFAQEMAKNDMQAPEQMAQSRLNQLTHEKDTQLLPEKVLVEKQNINAEQKFNIARQMHALLDEADAPPDQKEQMLRNGLTKIMDADPSMDEARKAARLDYYLGVAKNNPTGAKKMLEEQMQNWSKTTKSVQAEELVAARGREQQTNTLLRETQRAAAAKARMTPKDWGQYATQQLVEMADKFGYNSPEAQIWAAQSKEAKLAGPMLANTVAGQKPVYNIGENKVDTQKAPGITPPPKKETKPKEEAKQRVRVWNPTTKTFEEKK
jgi:hypothetical protein